VHKDSDARKSKVSTDTEAVNTQTAAGTRSNATTTAGQAAEAAKSSCIETTKYKAVSEPTSAAIDTAPTADERYDDLPQALPQRTAAHKLNVIFVDSINSFRYSSQWYCPSKVLP